MPTGKLRPWLCLVVVRKQEGVTLRVDRNLPLPVLEIKAPARREHELPDLSESWAWAHAQVTGSQREAGFVETIVGGRPGADGVAVVVSAPARSADGVSGLRRACVRAGTQSRTRFADSARRRTDELEAGLGFGAQSPAAEWRCRSISTGSFAPAPAAISKRWWDCSKRAIDDMPPEVGKRPMDISQPGFTDDHPLPSDTTLELEGALRVSDAPTAEWPEETRTPFQAELKDPRHALAGDRQQTSKDPLVAPPIYGCWQAARHTVDTNSRRRRRRPGWMN